MNLALIHGEFSATDTLALLSQMIQIKIKYHESKITTDSGEEDIKARESKIKKLQHEFALLKAQIQSGQNSFKIGGNIAVTPN
ncbi:hypothetical protein G4D82_12370 [Flavobacterium sp. CYK-4]|uniref:hypothetical protein n=1 Tax=Flavobacterium lotistagni TaxID=2709660 RepID=UPI00140DED4D|nr:hypothetical protein [Flavobacterium lotistagni]NHM08020.1 hypothetical protein [Flavobacterium lotistagni]